MSRSAFFKNQVIAAGERVLGKSDLFPPVAFYLCKNGQGDICTPWALACAEIWDGGQTPGVNLASKIVQEHNKKLNRGSDPRPKWTATNGFINIHLTDSYILKTVRELAADFNERAYKNIRPDSDTDSFFEDYIIYLAVNRGLTSQLNSFNDNMHLRTLGVLVVYADITGNTEKLKTELYSFIRQGTDPWPGILRAAAQIFTADPQHK